MRIVILDQHLDIQALARQGLSKVGIARSLGDSARVFNNPRGRVPRACLWVAAVSLSAS